MPAEEADVRNIVATVRYGHFATVLSNGNKCDKLIVRSFDVELNLRVLVGYAQRFYGGGSRVDDVAVVVHRFAEAFRPKLAIPVGNEFQIIRIGHKHVNIFALLHSYVL